MTTTDLDVADHHAAGSLADELPYWGWLPDDRTCLTRRGELVTLARLTPTVVDGHTPAQLDAVLNRWQRMLSGIDSRTRIYFYLLRRPAIFPDADTGLSAVADLGQRKRRAFLGSRIQQIDTYLAWCYDPRLSTAAAGTHHAPWWKHYVQTWMKGRRNPNEAIYVREQIEDAAARFRQQVDASRTLVADLTTLDILTAHEGSRLLAELVNKPGRPPWDGATGSGLNWRLAYSELEAERRHLRLDGEPVILYSLVSPPARATANLLNDLYRLDSVMTVTLEWRPWDLDAARRKIRGAQRHYFSKRYSMMAHVQETEGTATAMVDSASPVVHPPRSRTVCCHTFHGCASGPIRPATRASASRDGPRCAICGHVPSSTVAATSGRPKNSRQSSSTAAGPLTAPSGCGRIALSRSRWSEASAARRSRASAGSVPDSHSPRIHSASRPNSRPIASSSRSRARSPRRTSSNDSRL